MTATKSDPKLIISMVARGTATTEAAPLTPHARGTSFPLLLWRISRAGAKNHPIKKDGGIRTMMLMRYLPVMGEKDTNEKKLSRNSTYKIIIIDKEAEARLIIPSDPIIK